MMHLCKFLLTALVVPASQVVLGQGGGLGLPRTVAAGSAFTIENSGSGPAVLYIAGPGQAMRRNVQLGKPIQIEAGTMDNAGHYLAVLVSGSSAEKAEFDILPAAQPSSLSFLAKPSRLPVGLHNGITGAVYVLDAYQNLITAPETVSFQLSGAGMAGQTKTAETRNGSAWTEMDSASKEGAAKFVAQVGNVASTRVIEQVPGDPCGLRVTAQKSGRNLELETSPVRDCSGNAVPDGTIVTFTETYQGSQTTVDAPLKHGVAKAEVPAYDGARISAATGVVMGNEIHWGK